MGKAYDQYTAWLERSGSLPLEQAVQDASTVWDAIAKSYYYEAIGFAVWSFWALVFLAFYVPAGGYLVVLLYKQVKHQKTVLEQQNSPTPPIENPGSFQPMVLPPENARTAHSDDTTAVPEDGLSPPVSPRYRKSLKAQVKDDFFPPLRSDEKERFRRLSSAGSPSSRFHYLRRCLVNLIILYTGVIAAAVIFTLIAVRLAASEYESILKGPQEVADLISQSDLLASYASSLFGFLTVGSIWLRNFDPGAPIEKEKKKEFARNSKGVEKTRKLPAVPESVGVDTTMDRSLAGLQQKGTIQLALVMEDELVQASPEMNQVETFDKAIWKPSPAIPEMKSFPQDEDDHPVVVVRRSDRESAASRIAREWQTCQYTRAPLPQIPPKRYGLDEPMQPSPPSKRKAVAIKEDELKGRSPGVFF